MSVVYQGKGEGRGAGDHVAAYLLVVNLSVFLKLREICEKCDIFGIRKGFAKCLFVL